MGGTAAEFHSLDYCSAEEAFISFTLINIEPGLKLSQGSFTINILPVGGAGPVEADCLSENFPNRLMEQFYLLLRQVG